MKKIQSKRIILGLLFIFMFLFPITLDVFAEEEDAYTRECREVLPNINAYDRYGLKIEKDSGENMYKIVMHEIGTSNPTLKQAIESIKFKIVKKNGQPYTGSNNIVTINSPVTGIVGQFVDTIDNETGESEKLMTLDLESTETNKDPDCTGTVYVSVNVAYSGENQYETIHFDLPSIDPGQGFYNYKLSEQCARFINPSMNKQDAANSDLEKFKNDPFKANFCYIYDLSDFNNKANGNYSLKCNKDLYVDSSATDDKYYVNKNYYYDSETTSFDQGYYYNHFSPSFATQQSDNAIKCDVTCEEAVKVEYGPPVSSIGGVCFEYKVKVTSYVNCSSTTPPPPKGDYGICTPSPTCTSNYRSYYLQGGPDDDFDDCVNACDGGKYTKKCSKKCYKKVYGNLPTALEYDGDSFYNYAYAKKLEAVNDSKYNFAACKADSRNNNGCYYRSGSAIYWSATRVNRSAPYANGGYEVYSAGRWYIENARAHKNYANYTVSRSDGFYRHNLGDGKYCNDTCWWNYCPYNSYLNYGFAEKDWNDNIKKYEDAIAACKAKASCSSKTAEMTMKVKYSVMKNGAEDERYINFPYTENNAENKDLLSSKGTKDNLSDTSTNKNSTIISKNGCYVSIDQKNNYQVEISFPGSWESRKGEGFVYIPQDITTHIEHERQFCIPDSAIDVNMSWDHYITKKFGHYEEYSSSTSEEIKNICGSCQRLDSTKCIPIESIDINKESPTPDVDDNIQATVTNFGYLGWNFNVSCFYAQSHNKSCINDEKCSSCYNNAQYKVRTVDLKNLFPKSDGNENAEVTELGRIRGYNWSDYAIISKDLSNPNATKDNAYVSVPSNIARSVQDKGYTIYDDDKYLDYEFKLSPSIIKEIKKDSKKYTDYRGSYINLDGNISVYKSNLFRNSGLLDKSGVVIKIPSDDQLYCNNIDSSSDSAGCEQLYN